METLCGMIKNKTKQKQIHCYSNKWWVNDARISFSTSQMNLLSNILNVN